MFLSTGAEVICAETVMNPVQLYNAEQIPEMEDELKFLFTIRSVFLKSVIMPAPPPLEEGGSIKDWFPSSVCLSVCLSRVA